MKKQIVRVSPVQTAKVMAVLYFVLTVPLFAVLAFGGVLTPEGQRHFFSGLAWLMPMLYLVVGFLGTVLLAWAYNLAAHWVGGVEITLVDSR
ncbi:hypothetical protein [Eleftheria terrae]|uniref:hypothetical protein n=1 Tax=Eleftheria terrae TaxID=1597781 RepID=UPI00263AF1A2|nr:hypothetical protein [Eleftheria terrae]WKB54717.1 hypothetical protein N7L95_10175 [Eleftheria terrae]